VFDKGNNSSRQHDNHKHTQTEHQHLQFHKTNTTGYKNQVDPGIIVDDNSTFASRLSCKKKKTYNSNKRNFGIKQHYRSD
jgi:hypothetical protein